MANYVAPTGYIELDNDCQFAIDRKSTRSRENVNPSEDLAFYFNTYLVPKYGLNNINVNNTASYLKELDMNWSKLTPDLKDKVLDIMVDGIFKKGDYDFKNRLMTKLGIVTAVPTPILPSKSNFGKTTNPNVMSIIIGVIVLGIIIFMLDFFIKSRPGNFAKMS